MNSIEAYFTLFFVLFHCYRVCGEDRVGAVLGEMDPDLWLDKRPIDMGVYDSLCSYNRFSKLTASNADQIICEILDHLEREDPYYSFPQSRKIIKTMTEAAFAQIIQEAKEKSVDYYW